MLKEILTELKRQEPKLECWTEGLKQESYSDNTLTISVPNQLYIEKYETNYKNKIEEIATDIAGRKIYVQLQLLLSDVEIIQQRKIMQNIEAYVSPRPKLNPNFQNKTELENYVSEVKIKSEEEQKIVEIKSMPVPYGVEKVASFITFQNEFFTYPNDKRKKAKVKIKIKFDNGEYGIYDLFRGQSIIEDEGHGQLNTTHAKILLAITHIWQEQGCKFADQNGYFAIAKFNIQMLGKKLGYKNVSGTDYIRLLKQLEELANIPNILRCQDKSLAFSFLSSLTIDRDEKKKWSRILITAVFSPFASKELYERKSFYREPQCYRLQNPTAVKFLLAYDRVIVKGNSIAKSIEDIAQDMQIKIVRKDNLIRDIRRAVKELNGYDLNDMYSLKIDLKKLDRNYIVTAERIVKT